MFANRMKVVHIWQVDKFSSSICWTFSSSQRSKRLVFIVIQISLKNNFKRVGSLWYSGTSSLSLFTVAALKLSLMANNLSFSLSGSLSYILMDPLFLESLVLLPDTCMLESACLVCYIFSSIFLLISSISNSFGPVSGLSYTNPVSIWVCILLALAVE